MEIRAIRRFIHVSIRLPARRLMGSGFDGYFVDYYSLKLSRNKPHWLTMHKDFLYSFQIRQIIFKKFRIYSSKILFACFSCWHGQTAETIISSTIDIMHAITDYPRHCHSVILYDYLQWTRGVHNTRTDIPKGHQPCERRAKEPSPDTSARFFNPGTSLFNPSTGFSFNKLPSKALAPPIRPPLFKYSAEKILLF